MQRIRREIIATCIFLALTGSFLFISTGALGKNPAVGDQNWAMFHHDLTHSGSSPSTAPNTNNILWTYDIGGVIFFSPVVVDGKVYISSMLGRVFCLDATNGAHIWNHTIGGIVESSPAVVDNKLYIGTYNTSSLVGGVVYCLDAATGTPLWNYTTGAIIHSSPAVLDGKVYICPLISISTTALYGPTVQCLDAATGTPLWNYTTGSMIFFIACRCR
jgi:outer membrane protein assembly factor BamB